MRGEVLHYDDNAGRGYISGDDGERYLFERSAMAQLVAVGKGTRVDFRADRNQALEIFVVSGAPVQFGRAADPGEALGLFGYFKKVMTSHFANFSGRARRKEYWSFALFAMLALIAAVGIGMAADSSSGTLEDYPPVTIALVVLVMLVFFIPSISVMVRRIHDLGLSGWFYLLFFIPYVGNLILLVFALMPSQKFENKYGPVPAGIKV